LCAGLLVFVGVSHASAQNLTITGGTLDADLNITQSAGITLQGDRGFTFTGASFIGHFKPWDDCHLVGAAPCGPGDRVSLYASWSSSDLPGVATLDGTTYPKVGGPADPGLTVEFFGSVLLPPLSESATVVAPIAFDGKFYVPGGPITLFGSGMATLTITPDRAIPGRWRVNQVHYQLGPALPSPWMAADVGAVSLPGRSAAVGDSIVVLGDGTDVWGTADAFRFVHQPVSGDTAISAHLSTGEKTYPVIAYTSTTPDAFAKAGLMLRESLGAGSPSVIVDVKPNGEIEFMVRYAAGEPTIYLGGADTGSTDLWLSLRRTGNSVSAAYSADGHMWVDVGSASVPFGGANLLGGIAVTSHDPSALFGVLADHVSIRSTTRTNLLTRGNFEDYNPPALGLPGWVSDDDLRQVPAKSETHQPHSGFKNGACWTPDYLDCGMYQEVNAPASGRYTFTIYATADRPGGLVGVNVNGLTATYSEVNAAAFGAYALHTMTITAAANDIVRVWMYSPASPGYVVVDDASLVLDAGEGLVTSGTWTITPIASDGAFSLTGATFDVNGTYDGGPTSLLSQCATSGQRCRPGDTVNLSAGFTNETPVPFENPARGSATIGGVTYSPVQFGGTVSLSGGSARLPDAAPGDLAIVTSPFTISGTLKGFNLFGEPSQLFAVPLAGGGTARAELLAGPGIDGSIVFSVYRITYEFEPQ
jgi:hypothetical protein